MLENAKKEGEIRGLVTNLVEGGITHLQYADDTIIFLNLDDQSIVNTKFLLYCFEEMSGLRVNYQKSEVFVLGSDEEETNRVAEMFNCNVGQLPMRYLGIMVNNSHMTANDLSYVHQKVEKRIPTWKSAGLSSGGKMILIESCLSSVPNYTMSVYLLQEEVHQKMDSARANFFWHGPNMKRKYHMAKWETLATPKNVGGVGFTNTRVMNKCLLSKWIYKLERGDDTLCCNLLRRKYLKRKGIYNCKNKSGSQFWKGLLSIKDKLSRGMSYIVRDGQNTRFWMDVWSGTCPLMLTFPRLYDLCNQQNWVVAKVLRNGTINLTFRRNFGETEQTEWETLRSVLEGVTLSSDKDTVRWVLEKSGQFTTSSLYREITFPGMYNKWMCNIWSAKLPPKIKFFLWQICNDKIQSARKNWAGPTDCKLCGSFETTEHIFTQCVLAKFGWSVLRDVLEWNCFPANLDDLHNKLVEGSVKNNSLFVFFFGCFAWSLWLTRNDLVFNDIVVNQPDVIVFRTISFMQKWKLLLREQYSGSRSNGGWTR
jgi:hypothetical protein